MISCCIPQTERRVRDLKRIFNISNRIPLLSLPSRCWGCTKRGILSAHRRVCSRQGINYSCKASGLPHLKESPVFSAGLFHTEIFPLNPTMPQDLYICHSPLKPLLALSVLTATLKMRINSRNNRNNKKPSKRQKRGMNSYFLSAGGIPPSGKNNNHCTINREEIPGLKAHHAYVT